MEKTIRLVTGIIFLVLSIILFVVSIFLVFTLIFAIPLFVIGIALLVNAGDEDKIEGVKRKKLKRVIISHYH